MAGKEIKKTNKNNNMEEKKNGKIGRKIKEAMTRKK